LLLNIYIFIVVVLTVIYVAIVLRYVEGWRALPYFNSEKKSENNTTLSVLIPARNEEQNISQTLQAVFAQNYPTHLFEVIVIDDHSTDNTAIIVKQFIQQYSNISLIRLAEHDLDDTQSFKKKALEIAIQNSNYQLIVTTDSDCIMNKNWLSFIADYYEKYKPAFIAAPVIFHDEKNTFQRFQSLDFVGMMGVNGAGIFRKFQYLCNGANLAYEREAFYEVDGFEGIDKLASGDDLMLIQKMAKRYPNRIAFLKNVAAATRTTPKRSLREFMSQRIRWATKTTHYPDPRVTLTWALIWLFCVSIPTSFLLSIFFGKIMLWMGLGQLLIKALVDHVFLNSVATTLKRKDLVAMRVYLPSIFLELLYIIVIGTLGNIIKNYEWKGRKVR